MSLRIHVKIVGTVRPDRKLLYKTTYVQLDSDHEDIPSFRIIPDHPEKNYIETDEYTSEKKGKVVILGGLAFQYKERTSILGGYKVGETCTGELIQSIDYRCYELVSTPHIVRQLRYLSESMFTKQEPLKDLGNPFQQSRPIESTQSTTPRQRPNTAPISAKFPKKSDNSKQLRLL